MLHYYVLQRRREIGIRIAVGAGVANIARIVTIDAFIALAIGSAAGLALGVASARFVASLFYQVKATDPPMLIVPAVILALVAVLAAIPAVIRASRVDPASLLRVEQLPGGALMSLWLRLRNTFRSFRLHREIDYELESHIPEPSPPDRQP